MAKHQANLVRCSRLPGAPVGRVCTVHDGRCVACDSMVWPSAPARVCDGCSAVVGYGRERCLVCGCAGGGEGGGAVAGTYYCKAYVQTEKDRDSCPAVVNAGTARRDATAFFVRSKLGGGFKATMA